jgi:hypothetical protein
MRTSFGKNRNQNFKKLKFCMGSAKHNSSSPTIVIDLTLLTAAAAPHGLDLFVVAAAWLDLDLLRTLAASLLMVPRPPLQPGNHAMLLDRSSSTVRCRIAASPTPRNSAFSTL